LTLEKKFFRMFSDYLQIPHSISTRKAILQACAYAFASSVPYFLYAAAFRFGLFLILDHDLTPMDVLKSLFAISFTSGSMGFASAYFPEYAKARLAAGIIFKMLAEEPKIDSSMTGGKKNPIRGSVSLKGVLFSYPQRPTVSILNGLDLEVEPGQTLALVGPSGCGKSTVVSLLERFYDPNGGRVVCRRTIQGKIDSTFLDDRQRRRARVQRGPCAIEHRIGLAGAHPLRLFHSGEYHLRIGLEHNRRVVH
jgi:ATP-binding cassette subfamily B (MDR/TAP) protein 1